MCRAVPRRGRSGERGVRVPARAEGILSPAPRVLTYTHRLQRIVYIIPRQQVVHVVPFVIIQRVRGTLHMLVTTNDYQY